MRRIYTIWNYLYRTKYLLVSLLGVLLIGFVGENSVFRHVRNLMEADRLRGEISAYRMEYEEGEHTLRELKRNPKAVVKIAREKYFMKADDEDIYVLSDDRKKEGGQDETVE